MSAKVRKSAASARRTTRAAAAPAPKTVGVLTAGGDCPGLNAVLRAIVLSGRREGYRVLGFRHGWEGLYRNGDFTEFDEEDLEELSVSAGTMIGTSRFDPHEKKDGVDRVLDSLKNKGCQSLIVIGGSESVDICLQLLKRRLRVVLIPKTIDNDIKGTDNAFGFDTAVNVATEALDRLHVNAKSHSRVLVVEVMGRETGWMALHAGLAGRAHAILIPEEPFSVQDVCDLVVRRNEQGFAYSVIVVAEGAQPREHLMLDEFHKIERDPMSPFYTGVAFKLAKVIFDKTGMETRHIVLGHLQRTGTPSAYDRVLGAQMGQRAIELLAAGKSGRMVALDGGRIQDVPLKRADGRFKRVPHDLYRRVLSLL
ncbi:MAG: 6-phosphofructokinase [Candidatus Sumerlaeia bacterium]